MLNKIRTELMKYVAVLFFILCHFSAISQDSLIVKEACIKLKSKEKLQLSILQDYFLEFSNTEEYSNSLSKFRDMNNFFYKLSRELIRNCPQPDLVEFPIVGQRVIDIEALLSKIEIDSLKTLTSKLLLTENVNLIIVTIDDYYPSTTIKDFARKKLSQWNDTHEPEKGDVLLVISTSNRSLYLSTTQISTSYLDDKSCEEIIEKITPYLKRYDFFRALITGVEGVSEKLKYK